MMLEDIGTYLATTYTGLVTPNLVMGFNLFISRLQDDPDLVVALYESPAGEGGYTLGSGKRQYEEMALQVVVRDKEYNYNQARTLIERIINLLDNIVGVSLSGTTYMRIKAAGTVIPLPADSMDRVLLSANFIVLKELNVVAIP